METDALLNLLLEKIRELEEQLPTNETLSIHGILHFNREEVGKMPKAFRKEFRAQGCTAHVRKRTDGRYNCSYEIRYHRNGYAISASATTLDEAKQEFIKNIA